MGVAFISLSSNTSRTSSLSEGIYPGNLFPDIQNLENVSGTKINLSDLRGRKVLVNFWAAYDASSHKNNVLLSHVIENKNYPVQMVSVSFDKTAIKKALQDGIYVAGAEIVENKSLVIK